MAKKTKLPKRIAGVKIPKRLRKRGGQVYAFLGSPLVSNMVAAALLVAADNIARKPKAKKAARKVKQAAADTAQATGENVIDFASILATAAREGARLIKSNSR